MKNPTPRQIALYSALFTAIVVFVLVLAIQLITGRLNLTEALLASVLIIPFTYALNRYLLNTFIYRKVKLIYKNIHERKRDPKLRQKLTLHDNILDEVEQEVMDWADDKAREIKELQEREKYRREFIGNVSHELKTPIFNIQGYLHTLIDGGINDEKVNLDYLYKAARNLDRLDQIVKDLEVISLLESGHLSMQMEKFDIHSLAKEVMDSLELQAESNEVTLSFKKDSNKSTLVVGDKKRIRQVLTNLINNALKYSRENGRCQLGFYDMDEYVLIEVSDNGIGIDQKHLPRLFERFYRVDKSRARHEGGTGLGLAIVKHIIEAHGQTINVRSTPGVGSTFGFTLKKA